MTVIVDGILREVIPVLWIIMASMGPTPVAGTNGTTAGFLQRSPAAIERPSEFRPVPRLR